MTAGGRARNVVASPLSAVAGDQYFGLNCVACREQFAVLNDVAQDQAPVTAVGSGFLHVVCPYCAAERLYALGDLKLFRQP
jgi:hypothetical protein